MLGSNGFRGKSSKIIKAVINQTSNVKTYRVIKLTAFWSTSALTSQVQQLLNRKTHEGYEIVSVSFGVNMWWKPTAFITVCKTIS